MEEMELSQSVLLKRRRPSLLIEILTPVLAVALALAVGAFLILVVGVSPLVAYVALVRGAFGSANSLTQIVLKATPLLLIGLGLTVAFRCKVWNIGAEGQFYMGALAATWVGVSFGGIPTPLMLPLVGVAGFTGGALWGVIPAVLKIKRGVNEIISTLMMNYIAIFFLSYLVRLPLKDPDYYLPQTAAISSLSELPFLFPGSRLHAGIVVALLCVPLIYFVLWKTTLGYRIRAVGANPDAARYAGMNIARNIIMAMIISGGLAGLAGMVEVAGIHHRLLVGISPGYGYTAIVVALLGKLNPIGVMLAAYLFAVLVIGADSMQRILGIPVTIVVAIQALVILFVLGSEAFSRRRA